MVSDNIICRLIAIRISLMVKDGNTVETGLLYYIGLYVTQKWRLSCAD